MMKLKNYFNSSSKFGFLLILLTYFIFSLMELIAKDLAQRYNFFFIVFIRYFSQLLFLLMIFNSKFLNFLKSDKPKLQILRGTLLILTTCFMFAGLSILPFAEHIAVYLIGPVLTTILAVIFLKEKVSLKHIFLIFLGLFGAITIANPTNKIINIYVILPFAAAFFFSLFTVTTKYLNNSDKPSTTLIYTAISGTFLSIPLAYLFWKLPQSTFDFFLMISMGILVTLGHFCFIKALEYIDASVAAPFVNMTLLLAVFWGYMIYNEIPSVNTIIGALLIVISGIAITKIKKKKIKSKKI